MSTVAASSKQPDSFEFTRQNLAWANEQIEKYPEGKQASAIIPLLWRAQEQHDGWLPDPAINYIAEMLDMAPIRVIEVATFYSMFNLQPVGKYFVQLCGTTPCLLRGSDALVDVLKKRIGAQNHITNDGLFSWLEVECLGSCANAPMVQINKDYFEDLTADKFETLLDDLEAGRDVTPGPQNGRSCSCPDGGPSSLTDPALYENEGDMASAGVRPVSAASLANFAQDTGRVKVEPASPPQAEISDTIKDWQESDSQKAIPATSRDKGTAQKTAAEDNDRAISDDYKPVALAHPRDGRADDLKKISGVGPKLEETLHGLGVYHFDQIGEWTPQNVAWVDNFLSFKGRIDREDWISQARILANAVAAKDLSDEPKGEN